MKHIVAITIPIFKKEINQIEIISLTQCLHVLNKHPVIFFAPFSLDTSFYENFCRGKVDYKIERFEDAYFDGIAGYNKLLLASTFYERFLDFKYMLIYQLDAFVFKDELEYWCNTNYAYIGAPWLEKGFAKRIVSQITFDFGFLKKLSAKFSASFIKKYDFSGNGGFSLRNVNTFLKFIKYKDDFLKSDKIDCFNEDIFWGIYLPLLYVGFKTPRYKTSLKFSFEKTPGKSYQIINQLPTGCHAFSMYEPDFWKKYIPLQ